MWDSKRDADIKNSLLDSVGEGAGGMIWENSIVNMYITIHETDCQSRFNAWGRVLRAGALGWPRGMGWGGRWEGGSGWGTHVHPWLIHVNVWQKLLQYCKAISLQLKKKKDVSKGGKVDSFKCHKENKTRSKIWALDSRISRVSFHKVMGWVT